MSSTSDDVRRAWVDDWLEQIVDEIAQQSEQAQDGANG